MPFLNQQKSFQPIFFFNNKLGRRFCFRPEPYPVKMMAKHWIKAGYKLSTEMSLLSAVSGASILRATLSSILRPFEVECAANDKTIGAGSSSADNKKHWQRVQVRLEWTQNCCFYIQSKVGWVLQRFCTFYGMTIMRHGNCWDHRQCSPLFLPPWVKFDVLRRGKLKKSRKNDSSSVAIFNVWKVGFVDSVQLTIPIVRHYYQIFNEISR